MLTYSDVCCALSSARALSLNAIFIFEMACSILYFYIENLVLWVRSEIAGTALGLCVFEKNPSTKLQISLNFLSC
jgi:hypothetical protein